MRDLIKKAIQKKFGSVAKYIKANNYSNVNYSSRKIDMLVKRILKIKKELNDIDLDLNLKELEKK